jgi:O-acetylserine/cysteine efflux transporter
MTPRQILLAVVPPVCFGVGFTVAKPALQHFPPLMVMLIAYSGIAAILSVTHRAPLQTPWRHIFLISALAVTLQGACVFNALAGLSAVTANLVLQSQVPFAVVLGWLVGGERLDRRKSLGTVVALAGVAAVIGLPREPPPLGPVFLMMAGAFIWSLGQVYARKLGREGGIGLLKANAYGAIPQLAVASLLVEHGQLASLVTATPLQWAMLAFVCVVGYGIAYASWFAVLRQCRIDEVAPFMLLMPMVGIVAAFVLLGERIGPFQLAGGAIILLGLAIVSGLPRPARRAEGTTGSP